MLAGTGFIVGLVLLVAWATRRTGGADDDAFALLRGRFARLCRYHAGMVGTIVVTAR
jgi:hypothetical protein